MLHVAPIIPIDPLTVYVRTIPHGEIVECRRDPTDVLYVDWRIYRCNMLLSPLRSAMRLSEEFSSYSRGIL